MNKVIFTTEESTEFYVSSLAIGILEGMKSGGVALEAGIWSLARPVFWQALQKSTIVSSRLIDWVSSLDELDALENLDGSAHEAIDKLLGLLKLCQEKSLKNGPSLVISSEVVENF